MTKYKYYTRLRLDQLNYTKNYLTLYNIIRKRNSLERKMQLKISLNYE